MPLLSFLSRLSNWMLRIVGVERNEDPQREFVLLHNQGVFKINLRGHLLLDDSAFLDSGEIVLDRAYAFSEEVCIPPSCYVMLVTGRGENRWRKSADGSLVYTVFWGKSRSVWLHREGPLHLLGVTHSQPPRLQWASV